MATATELRRYGKPFLALSGCSYIAAAALCLSSAAGSSVVTTVSAAAVLGIIGALWTWDLTAREGRGWYLAWMVPFLLSAVLAACSGRYVIAGFYALLAAIFMPGLVPESRLASLLRVRGETSHSNKDQR